MTAPMMKIMGLDRFTKGKAVSGMRRAGQDQNPFDLGIVAVSETLGSLFRTTGRQVSLVGAVKLTVIEL